MEIEFHWTPKQSVATQAADTHRFTLYGGSRGPGKSYWLRWWLLRFVLMCNSFGLRGVRVGLFCENYPVLMDRQISKIVAEFPADIGRVKETRIDGLGFYLSEGRGVIALRNLDDPAKYQSAEFAAVGIDELTKNPVETFNILRGSLRWPGIRNVRFVAATNPGSIGHLWVKQYWIDRTYPPELQSRADEFAFVPALPDDNPYLDESYWDELESLPEELAQAWRWGKWDSFVGQVFKEWKRELHVIDPITPPTTWRPLRGVDWGFEKPACCLWGAQDPDTGRVIIYRELYEAGLTDRAQAQKIQMLSLPNERGAIHGDQHSFWVHKNFQGKTFTSADEYAREGVILTKASDDRIGGLRKIHTLLSTPASDGAPLLQVTSNCTALIRTLPALPHDKVNVEDVDTAAEDHAFDALKYLLTPVDARPKPKKKPGEPPAAGKIEAILRQKQRGAVGGKDF